MNTAANSKKKLIVRLVILLAVIGGGLTFWKYYLEDRVIAKRWGTVEEGKIYRSGQLSEALVKSQLEKHGIQVVIDLTNNAPADGVDQKAEREAIQELGIEQKLFKLLGDGTGEVEVYAKAVAEIRRSVLDGKTVLVHCAAGAQRTGGTIAAYRKLFQGKASEAIVQEMERYDWDREDDLIALEYLNKNMAEICRILVEEGLLDAVPDPLPRVDP